MTLKVKLEGLKKNFTIPLYLVLSFITGLIGYAEAGMKGLALGFASGILCALSSLLGLVPFVGIPLYFIVADWFNGLLGSIGIAIPIAQVLAFYTFLIFALISNVFISLIALLVILKLLGRK